ncbi:hypothetical protein [Dechloromonas denitrificans]|uniref:hypothetical protein n=1 Tax=Dechloromonas denitrificans TaxID=281362 RepID=UPI001CF85CC5|nr:hypothetical protein [Dechloromonas denitrificans]UCV01867.1 hypothetical protein KI611_12150 [Dechloromonas denitrificans]
MSNQTTEKAEAPKKATREQLEDLHRVLCKALMDYLLDTPADKRRASMIAEIRAFLRDNNVTKSLGAAKDVAKSLDELSGLGVPFLPTFPGNDSLN